jgi:acetyl-CoA C-acetyltransferase
MTLSGHPGGLDAFIVGAARTPLGSFQGALSSVPAPTLGSVAIRAAAERARVDVASADAVYMGNVLSAGLGQAPARQAAKYAGVPDAVPATTVSKVCGSGLEAVVLATRAVRLGDAQLVIAGGMESMSRAPYALPRARSGYRMGHGEILDLMIHDGLWDPYGNSHMGNAAELCSRTYGITREQQDAFAIESYRRALAAKSASAEEIAPVELEVRGKKSIVREDEEPGRGKLEQASSLKPAFEAGGTVTALNASKINDGAAAVIVASEGAVKQHGLTPLARIVSYGHHAQAPEWFTTAPVFATEKALVRAGVRAADVDLFEINEAFAVVGLACMQLSQLDHARVNVRGGAIALGHPIGASGARVLTTLIYALHERQKRYGLATLCIGGGEAVALLIERV